MIVWLLAELMRLGGRPIGLGQLAVSPRDLLAVTAIALVGLAVGLIACTIAGGVAASPLTSRAALT
jgi:hypothetical protein